MCDPKKPEEPPTIEAQIRYFFANRVYWRFRLLYLALIVGLLCGIVASLYEMVMDFVLEIVWEDGYEKFVEHIVEAAPFEAFARDGRVAFAAPRTLAQGAESCELRLSKVEGARHPFLSWASQGGRLRRHRPQGDAHAP